MRKNSIAAILGLLVLTITIGAQTKPPATFADFGQWETLSQAGSRGGFVVPCRHAHGIFPPALVVGGRESALFGVREMG